MEQDPLTGEIFSRIVGRRQRPPPGAPPSPERRAALAELARYRTRAPKGIYLYRTAEEADADRVRWQVEAMLAKQRP